MAEQGNYIWCGTGGGVVRWNRTDSSYVKYTGEDNLIVGSIGKIIVASNGNVWVINYQGASRFDGNNWTTYTTSDGLVANYV